MICKFSKKGCIVDILAFHNKCFLLLHPFNVFRQLFIFIRSESHVFYINERKKYTIHLSSKLVKELNPLDVCKVFKQYFFENTILPDYTSRFKMVDKEILIFISNFF